MSWEEGAYKEDMQSAVEEGVSIEQILLAFILDSVDHSSNTDFDDGGKQLVRSRV